MDTQRITFRVAPVVVTALCFLFYNPPMHVMMIRTFS